MKFGIPFDDNGAGVKRALRVMQNISLTRAAACTSDRRSRQFEPYEIALGNC